MATTTLPRRKKLSGRWIAVGIVLIVVAIAAALFVNGRGQTATATGQSTVPVTRQNLTAMIAGSGSVTAEQSLNLPFQMSGTVTEVLVKEGDTVQVGQELAKLDDRNLQLQVASARASLEKRQGATSAGAAGQRQGRRYRGRTGATGFGAGKLRQDRQRSLGSGQGVGPGVGAQRTGGL